MYDIFLLKTLFYYDINNSKKKDKKQVKKIFFIQKFVSNLQLQKAIIFYFFYH
jgi:hypothetical protein